MVIFWNWFVRNPALLLAGVSLFSGLANIVEWPLALAGTAVGAVVGDIGWHLGGRAEVRSELRRAAREKRAADRRRFEERPQQEREKVA